MKRSAENYCSFQSGLLSNSKFRQQMEVGNQGQNHGQATDDRHISATVVSAVSELGLWKRINVGQFNNFETACRSLDRKDPDMFKSVSTQTLTMFIRLAKKAVGYSDDKPDTKTCDTVDEIVTYVTARTPNRRFEDSPFGTQALDFFRNAYLAIDEKNPERIFKSLRCMYLLHAGFPNVNIETNDLLSTFCERADALKKILMSHFFDPTFIASDKAAVYEAISEFISKRTWFGWSADRSADIADQNSVATELKSLHSGDDCPYLLGDCSRPECVHVAFFLAHGEVVEHRINRKEHTMYFESDYTDPMYNEWKEKLKDYYKTNYINKSSSPISEQQLEKCLGDEMNKNIEVREEEGVMAIKSPSIIVYCEKWITLKDAEKNPLRNRHLIIVADLCHSGQLIDDLKALSDRMPNGKNPTYGELLKENDCSVSIQACCAANELAKGSYFVPTWIKMNEQLFGKCSEKRNSTEWADLYGPPDEILQHPRSHTIGKMSEELSKKIVLLESSHARATYGTWFSYLSQPDRKRFMNIEQYYRGTPDRANCTRILNSGKYTIAAVKFFMSRVVNGNLQIAALICPSSSGGNSDSSSMKSKKQRTSDASSGKEEERWIQHVHIDTKSVLNNWNGSIPGWKLVSDGMGHVPIEAVCEKFELIKDMKYLVIYPWAESDVRTILDTFLTLNKYGECPVLERALERDNVEFCYIKVKKSDTSIEKYLKEWGVIYYEVEAIVEHGARSKLETGNAVAATWGDNFIKKISELIIKHQSADVIIKDTDIKKSAIDWWNDLKPSSVELAPSLNVVLESLKNKWPIWASIPAGLRRTRYPTALYQGPYTE